MNDSAKRIKEQWGIDPLEGVTLNDVQQTIVDEALGNSESMRTEKPVGMDLENKYSGSFAKCDSLIGGLGNDLKKQLTNEQWPIMQCKKDICFCGLCAPKAKNLDTYKSIIGKYQKAAAP